MSERGTEERHGAGDRAQPTRLPRWVKVFLIVAVALVLLAVGVALVVGGEHGPGRHQAQSTTIGAPLPTHQPYTLGGLH